MGTFTDNLLKLTEFPFSYSLISLLTLIVLGEGLLDQPPERLAPLLILMSFVATTLSMTDPIGVLLKELLYGFRGRARYDVSHGEPEIITRYLSRKHPKGKGWVIGILGPNKVGLKIKGNEGYLRDLIEEMMKMPIFDSNLLKASSKIIIQNTVFISLAQNYHEIFSQRQFPAGFFDIRRALVSLKDSFEQVLDVDEVSQIFGTILSLKKASLGTVWMVREIDKITGMIYFLIVVSILISTLISDQFRNTNFLDKFLDIFQGTEQAKAQARIIILGLSASFFGAVLYKLIKRHKELRTKAFTTFLFLVAREAIKIEATKKVEKDTFDKSLQEIELYLTNGDWALAELSVQRVMNEYDDYIHREVIVGNKKINYQDLGIY